MTGHPIFVEEANALVDLHLLKSGGYGTPADLFQNFTRVAVLTGTDRWVYAQARIVEKAERVLSLTAQRRFSELAEEFRDQAGLAVCCLAMLSDDHPEVYSE